MAAPDAVPVLREGRHIAEAGAGHPGAGLPFRETVRAMGQVGHRNHLHGPGGVDAGRRVAARVDDVVALSGAERGARRCWAATSPSEPPATAPVVSRARMERKLRIRTVSSGRRPADNRRRRPRFRGASPKGRPDPRRIGPPPRGTSVRPSSAPDRRGRRTECARPASRPSPVPPSWKSQGRTCRPARPAASARVEQDLVGGDLVGLVANGREDVLQHLVARGEVGRNRRPWRPRR